MKKLRRVAIQIHVVALKLLPICWVTWHTIVMMWSPLVLGPSISPKTMCLPSSIRPAHSLVTSSVCVLMPMSLLWRHNGRGCVSNHQPYDCLLKRLFRRRSKKTSKIRVTGLCAGNSPGPVNSPHKWPVTRKMFPLMTSSWWWSLQSRDCPDDQDTYRDRFERVNFILVHRCKRKTISISWDIFSVSATTKGIG